MRARVLALLFFLSAAPPLSAEAFYNALQKPFRPPQAKLLTGARYQVRTDGTVWADGGTQPMTEAQLQSALQRLESAQRLQTLLQLKILFSKSAGEKYLTPGEREQVRKLVRENWAYFTLGTRKDFRAYFSVKELEELNRDPAPTDFGLSLDDMRDPEIDYSARFYEPPPPPQPRPTAAAPSPFLRATTPVLQPLGQPLQRPTFGPPATAYVPPAPAYAPPATVPAAPAPAAVVPVAPAPLPVPSPSATLSARAGMAPPAGTAPTVAAPTVAAPTVAAPTMAAPAAAVSAPAAVAPLPAPVPAPVLAPAASTAPAAQIETLPGATNTGLAPVPIPSQVIPMPTVQAPSIPPPPLEISAAEFDKFLADAPYGRDAKALLKIIADKAPAFARARALETARGAMPHVVIDSARSGLDARGSLLVQETAAGERGYAIALSPGPALIVRKRMFSRDSFLVADSPKVYGALHANPRLPDAAKKDSVALRIESGEWGDAKVYPDGSMRGSYSPSQQAGTLLRKLLRLDARRRGWDANPYAAELYGRTAEMMLYAKLAVEANGDAFLDPDLRVSLRLWLDHPHEWRDHLAHTLASGRVEMLDPLKGGPESQLEYNRQALAGCPISFDVEVARRAAAGTTALKKDIDALVALDLVGEIEAKQARDAVEAEAASRRRPQASAQECAARYQSEEASLKLASALLGEMNLAERKFREERGDVKTR